MSSASEKIKQSLSKDDQERETEDEKQSSESEEEFTKETYDSGGDARLCPGCGHNPITSAIKEAVYQLQIAPNELNVFGGIGCSGKTMAEIESFAIHTLHGCVSPVAIGSQLANPDQKHVVISGDGDSWAIGAGKMVALLRTNLDMVYICENNGTYGLTKGQFSPTTEEDSPNKYGETTGIPEVDGVQMALSGGATYVAKGFSASRKLLVKQIKAGILHDGLAYIDVLSPCVKFNDHEGSHHSYKYGAQHKEELPDFSVVDKEPDYPSDDYLEEDKLTVENFGDRFHLQFDRIKEHPDYDPKDRLQAMKLWNEYREKDEIPLGLLYVDEDRQSHHERYYEEGEKPISQLSTDELRPDKEELDQLLEQFK